MQQTLSQIADKWQADGEWIRPVNSLEDEQNATREMILAYEAKLVKSTYSSNLTGVFHVSELAEPVWQYKHADEWINAQEYTKLENIPHFFKSQYVTTKQP